MRLSGRDPGPARVVRGGGMARMARTVVFDSEAFGREGRGQLRKDRIFDGHDAPAGPRFGAPVKRSVFLKR
jgi:hypothetical protein